MTRVIRSLTKRKLVRLKAERSDAASDMHEMVEADPGAAAAFAGVTAPGGYRSDMPPAVHVAPGHGRAGTRGGGGRNRAGAADSGAGGMTAAPAQHGDGRDFEAHRQRLVGLAYRMLGSRAEAEDVVQDAYLRWHGVNVRDIDDPRRYLGTVVTRLCLDRLKSAAARREVYVGAWLPEPIVDESFDGDSHSDFAHDLSVALMLALERLSPLERAALLLHDVFDLDFAEVARALERNQATVRQLASRARDHLRRERPRFPVSAEAGVRLAAAFRSAADSGDAGALTALLAEDAILYTDGGGKKKAAYNPIVGADRIVRFFAGIARKNGALLLTAFRPATVNGMAGFVIKESDGSVATIALEARDDRIAAIYIVRNPDKLRHVQFCGTPEVSGASSPPAAP